MHTRTLLERAPDWMVVRAPERVTSQRLDLIASYIQFASLKFGSNPPGCLRLKIEQVGDLLEFSQELPAEFEPQNPASVSSLVAHAEQLSRLSGSREDAQKDGACMPSESLECAESHTEQALQTPQGVLWQSAAAGSRDAREQDDEFADLFTPIPRVHLVPVFNWESARVGDGVRVAGRDADSAKRIDTLLRRLQSTGSMRPLKSPVPDWSKLLDELASDFPNFAAVISAVIRPHLGLVARGYQHHMSSVLLVGPPGIGKTHFAHQLAKILNVGRPMFLSLATESNASSLAGSSTFWSNSSPGALFELLAWGEAGSSAAANPLIILDEIDKVSVDRFDPLGPLYTLLEVETAQTFKDQSIPDLLIDASHVRIFATANDISSLPSPLLSRTLVFNIARPSSEQLHRIALRIYQDIVKRLGVPMRPHVPPDILARAALLSPREAKVRLECAIANAVCDSRDHLIPGDWPDIDQRASQRPTIGFTSI